MSDCFQARRSGIIYKRYGVVLCLLFSSLSVSAAALETGDGSGIALIDSAWHTLIEFQRQVNAGVAIHMRALETGNSFAAFFLGLGVAFLYGMLHALGPGHGKFVIMSYFMGRELYVLRGLVMAVQMAVVHVIAAVVIVWVADLLLKTSLGIGLADVPGIRAGSFLIIAGIGIYMLYQAVRGSGVIHIPTTIHTTTIIITTDTVMIIHMAPATPPKVDWLHWRSVWSPALARYW